MNTEIHNDHQQSNSRVPPVSCPDFDIQDHHLPACHGNGTDYEWKTVPYRNKAKNKLTPGKAETRHDRAMQPVMPKLHGTGSCLSPKPRVSLCGKEQKTNRKEEKKKETLEENTGKGMGKERSARPEENLHFAGRKLPTNPRVSLYCHEQTNGKEKKKNDTLEENEGKGSGKEHSALPHLSRHNDQVRFDENMQVQFIGPRLHSTGSDLTHDPHHHSEAGDTPPLHFPMEHPVIIIFFHKICY